ncbi:Cycloartenol Synthase [Vitis vinifera]|uniref:Cycloartenol Synthase n=1 Tax=Vitis vinifera TaxID=29760 RepID=A0A438J466_VITVI|nr:Cycloartenol Synthase [Vitis vinifera]
MWRLKVADGGNDPYMYSTNNFVGRQIWEFDADYGTPEERAEVEAARENFWKNRFQLSPAVIFSGECRPWACFEHTVHVFQGFKFFARENPCVANLPQIKVQDLKEVTEEVVMTTLRRGLNFYSTIQAHDGHWPGDYGGPMFLLPGLVITLYITGALNVVLSIEHQREMCRYLFNHQARLFSYILALLKYYGGFGAEGAMEKGRKWILDHGGATSITSWGKMWLSVLGAYEWSGNNPLPPEVWLCPYILPIHPGLSLSLSLSV